MDTAPSTVQHVTKASSDELLRKFAEIGSKSDDTKRRRKRTRPAAGSIDDQCAGLVERKSLLPPVDRRSAALVRRLGMGRSRLRARGFKNKSVLGTIEKTWRRTVEGALKVFLEKHHNRHKRLINEVA
ncbi:hypothetical protein Vadar_003488 [Vaccinium darrowii]|uniref:Uncharacterized protein n=1 Tax=Vaccinium darrowii TaxID=229202 RepID=A0ACB7YJF5_9ERIC|nr:hypothetical protein Vadar_003488 [Vaccinium darrowii]